MSEDNPLAFFTSDELISEIGKRVECLVVVWVKSLSNNEEEYEFTFRGSRTTALGLLHRAEFGVLNELDIKQAAEDDEEEGE